MLIEKYYAPWEQIFTLEKTININQLYNYLHRHFDATKQWLFILIQINQGVQSHTLYTTLQRWTLLLFVFTCDYLLLVKLSKEFKKEYCSQIKWVQGVLKIKACHCVGQNTWKCLTVSLLFASHIKCWSALGWSCQHLM